jgi:hypothetical protein
MNNTALALRRAGLIDEAKAVESISKKDGWSMYTRELLDTAAGVATDKKVLDKLHILLYTSDLSSEDRGALKKQHSKEIVWLDKEDEDYDEEDNVKS